MKRLILSLSVCTLLLIACGGDQSNNSSDNNDVINNDNNNNECLKFAISKMNTAIDLDPISVTDVTSFHVASQIFEPLLRLNEKDLSVEPLLAESWEVSEDNLTVSINLKKGVFFQDNACFENGKGRELKASDVLYTFKRIFTEEGNYAYSLLKNKIVGSEEFKTNGKEISGISIVDDYTITFTLTQPSSNFTSLLATISTGIVAKEAIQKNVVVGCGPFVYKPENADEKSITLEKNKNYHLGKEFPYLNSVSYNYVKSGQDQLDLFMKGELDVITGIPSNAIKEIVEEQIADFQHNPVKYLLVRSPQASTSYLSLNTSKPPFDNIKVRKAIAMAIDKSRIVDKILKGEAAGPGDHGIVTSALKGYDYSSVVGLEFDVAKAKEQLASAGFKDGTNFPTLILTCGKGNTNLRVAFEIQKQLASNLNVNVEISSVTLSEQYLMNSKSECHFSLKGWLAEYPDPTSFLSLYYGKDVPSANNLKSFPNESRYKNSEFDKLYEQALVTLDKSKRYELCLTADQIIASEVPGIPLWYREDYHLIQSKVKGYQPNAMNIQNLVHVKLEEVSAKEINQ
ncbi:MAG: ABC transporter substrate-binding protein [Vicingaceae bacterium]|nr:ABC transporter substrate-binding protein [Vicingaceae bacterium]